MIRPLVKSLETQPNLSGVAQCASFAEGASAIASRKAHVLITDLQLPDGHGFDLMRLARKQIPEMVISVLGDEKSVVTGFSAGAAGFLLKDTQAQNIVKNLHEPLASRSPISTSVARFIIRVVQQFAGPGIAASILTDRETDILWGIAKGYTYKDVAERLGISANTVPTHIKNIYPKLKVNSRGPRCPAAG